MSEDLIALEQHVLVNLIIDIYKQVKWVSSKNGFGMKIAIFGKVVKRNIYQLIQRMA